MSATCEICGKEFKNTQGRRGHMTFLHGMSKGGFNNLVTRVATDQNLLPTKRVQQLASNVDSEGELRSKLEELSELQKNLLNFFPRNSLGQIITVQTDDKALERLSKLEEKLERLNRYIQYEIAGISNDNVWSFFLDHTQLKKGNIKGVYRTLDGSIVRFKTS